MRRRSYGPMTCLHFVAGEGFCALEVESCDLLALARLEPMMENFVSVTLTGISAGHLATAGGLVVLFFLVYWAVKGVGRESGAARNAMRLLLREGQGLPSATVGQSAAACGGACPGEALGGTCIVGNPVPSAAAEVAGTIGVPLSRACGQCQPDAAQAEPPAKRPV
jgi:hypothetical protein